MAPIAPRSQASFFYSSTWTKQVDTRFISRLVREANASTRPISLNNTGAIRNAQQEINEVFGSSFSFHTCLTRFRKLRDRFDVFSFILNLNGMNYDEMHNTLHASEYYQWDYICMKHRICEAYMIEGEAAWHELTQIFGDPEPNSFFTHNETVDLTSDASGSVEILPDNNTEPRNLDNQRTVSHENNAFWDEHARRNAALRSPSVVVLSNSVEMNEASPPREPRPPRCLWPCTDFPVNSGNGSDSHGLHTWSNSSNSLGLQIWPASSDVSDEASSSVKRRNGKAKKK